MSKQIIADWQPNCVTLAICSVRGQSVQLEKVCQTQFSSDADSEFATAADALAAAARELGLGKSEVTVVASRELVEVRTLDVPRIEAEELPDIIRFQAQRQLANMADNWTLDYVMLPDDPSQEMQTALVGAIAPQYLAEMESACAGANLQVSHVALGPIELARLATASGKLPTDGASMVICLSRDTADLLILKSNQVALLRSTKLPSEKEAWATVLGGEVRRSLMAASSQLGTSAVKGVMLMARPELSAEAEDPIEQAVGQPISLVDPSSLLSKHLDSRERLLETSGNRIGVIAGAALHPLADRAGSLDFKNPKKRPPKKQNTLLYALAGAAALLVAAAGVSWWFNTNRTLDEDLEFYRNEIEGKELLAKSAQRKIKQLREIESFLDGAPNFLDELNYVSKRIPTAEKVILGGPTFSTLADGRGQIQVPIAADSAETISQFEQSLRDEQHVVKSKENRISDRPTKLYKWEAIETITIEGRGWPLLAENQTPKQNPPATDQDSPESPGEPEGGTEEDSQADVTPTEPKNKSQEIVPDESKSASFSRSTKTSS